jgi:hypothetical protein
MSWDPTNFNPNEHKGSGGYGDDKPLEPGTYVFVVKQFKRSRKNGKDKIMFICPAILDSAGNKMPDGYMPVFEHITLTEKAAWRLGDLCAAIGHTSPFNCLDDRQTSEALRLKPFKAKIKKRTYQGQEQIEFAEYKTLSSAEEKLADEILEDMAMDSTTGSSDPGGYDDDPGPGDGDYAGDFDDSDLPF